MEERLIRLFNKFSNVFSTVIGVIISVPDEEHLNKQANFKAPKCVPVRNASSRPELLHVIISLTIIKRGRHAQQRCNKVRNQRPAERIDELQLDLPRSVGGRVELFEACACEQRYGNGNEGGEAEQHRRHVVHAPRLLSD